MSVKKTMNNNEHNFMIVRKGINNCFNLTQTDLLTKWNAYFMINIWKVTTSKLFSEIDNQKGSLTGILNQACVGRNAINRI